MWRWWCQWTKIRYLIPVLVHFKLCFVPRFITHTVIIGKSLDAATAFTTMALMDQLRASMVGVGVPGSAAEKPSLQ